jgi:hypothetical protein
VSSRRLFVAVLVSTVAGVGSARGQQSGIDRASLLDLDRSMVAASRSPAFDSVAVTKATHDDGILARSINRLPTWSAPLASLVIPGVGQARLKQGRAIAYFAAETFLLLQYRKDLNEGRRNERDYRDIARTIARRGFVASPPDTVWQYYEKLSEYVESGAFSMVPNGPTVPETDPQTYNGYQWKLAREQYGVAENGLDVGTLQYGRALALYESRAMRQPYRWSWRNAQLEKDIYVRAISRTNDAYRRATLDLSALIANHLLSAVDAFARVRLSSDAGGAMRVSASIALP